MFISSLKSNNPKISSGNPNLAMNLEKATSVLQTILKDYRKEVVPIYNSKRILFNFNEGEGGKYFLQGYWK